MKSGIYVRAEIQPGKWRSVDITQLSELQLEEFFADKTKAEVLHWFGTVLGIIRRIEVMEGQEHGEKSVR